MTIPQAIGLGLVGEKLSREITGTEEVSVGRSTVAVGTGAALGAAATGALVVGAGAVGATALAAAAAPIVVPLAIASGVIAGIRSFFD